MPKAHHIPMDAWEIDAFSGWRRLLCCMYRAGIRKSAKQGYNRRQRRKVRGMLKEEEYDRF